VSTDNDLLATTREENSEFCMTIGTVTRNAGILGEGREGKRSCSSSKLATTPLYNSCQ